MGKPTYVVKFQHFKHHTVKINFALEKLTYLLHGAESFLRS